MMDFTRLSFFTSFVFRRNLVELGVTKNDRGLEQYIDSCSVIYKYVCCLYENLIIV